MPFFKREPDRIIPSVLGSSIMHRKSPRLWRDPEKQCNILK